MQTRIRRILEDLEAVRENLLALSDDIALIAPVRTLTQKSRDVAAAESGDGAADKLWVKLRQELVGQRRHPDPQLPNRPA